jgi:restriction endonuclease S subunit
VGAIRPFSKDFVPLINLFLKSNQLLDMVFATATGTAAILDLPFPLPPLAEQRRIVAKVDQLMALVDQLETQLAASRTAAINLMEAVVAELGGQIKKGSL